MKKMFELLQSFKKTRARLGLFSLTTGHQSPLATPAALLYIRRGVCPHLTIDHLECFGEQGLLGGLQVCLDELMDVPGVNTLEKYGKGLASYLGLDNFILFGTLRDPLKPISDTNHTMNTVSFPTFQGRRECTPEEYARAMQCFQLDAFSLISDSVADVQASDKRCRRSADRSLTYQRRAISLLNADKTPVFLSIEGGILLANRIRSLEGLSTLPCHGYVLEGLGIGESREERNELYANIFSKIPEDKMRFAHGGMTELRDVLDAIHHGVDLIDGTLPAILSDLGDAFVFEFEPDDNQPSILHLWNQEFFEDHRLLKEGCTCPSCNQGFTRSYIHHLLKTHEMLAQVALMLHNTDRFLKWMKYIREFVIPEDRFSEYRVKF